MSRVGLFSDSLTIIYPNPTLTIVPNKGISVQHKVQTRTALHYFSFYSTFLTSPGAVSEIMSSCSYVSLVPRLSCVGGEKRAWYTLFAHAQFSQDFWEFGYFP